MGHAFKVYVTMMLMAGMAVLTVSEVLYPVYHPAGAVFFMLIALAAEAIAVVAKGRDNAFAISGAAAGAAMLISGPTAAMVTAAVIALCTALREQSKTKPVLQIRMISIVQDISYRVLSCAAMAFTYFGLGGNLMMNVTLSQSECWLALLAVAILMGLLTDLVLTVVQVSLKNRGQLFRQLVPRLPAMAENALTGLLGAFLAVLYVGYGWPLVVLFYIPLLLAYCAFITYRKLQQNYMQTVDCLASALEAKDAYTCGHSRRVEEYSGLIAQELKLSEKRCENLRYAAILHDIGKIGIPERILNKPDRLDEEEWEYIKTHSEKGAHILGDIAFLRDAVEIVRSHHEWYNGGGYPNGKSAVNMPVEAMVICVADAYDAMTSDRPYRKRLPAEQAMTELHAMAGIQFSPEIVEAFERAMVKNGGSLKAAQ